MKTVVVFFADGMEECEALLVVDLLRRAHLNVITASVMGRTEVTSAHQIKIKADALAEEVDYDSADMLVLPGGMPGTTHLGESETVREKCREFAETKYIAAICAAPTVFASLGLLEGRQATCFPGMEEQMKGAILTNEGVTVDGNIITGQALGSAIRFALELIKTLLDEQKARQVGESIYWS